MNQKAPTLEEVIACVRGETGSREPITGETELGKDLGVDGDDMDDVLQAYYDRFGVNMDSYLWYFHCCEEGMHIGSLFFKAPWALVDPIPITMNMLHEFALKGRWDIEYPPHTYPERRYDIWVDTLIFGGIALIYFVALVAVFLDWLWNGK